MTTIMPDNSQCHPPCDCRSCCRRGQTTTIMPNNRRMNPRLTEDVSGLLAIEEAGLQRAKVELKAATAAKGQAQTQERTAKRVRTTAPTPPRNSETAWNQVAAHPRFRTTAAVNPDQLAWVLSCHLHQDRCTQCHVLSTLSW